MKITNLSPLANQMLDETLGAMEISTEDLTNIVDVGKRVLLSEESINKFTSNLIDRVGRQITVNREYKMSVPDIRRDGWEFGSMLQKIDFDLKTASTDEAWNLVDGASYDPNVYHENAIRATYYNQRETFQVVVTIIRDQLFSAFNSVEQFNSMIAGLNMSVQNSINLILENCIRRIYNNHIAETIHDECPDGDYKNFTGTKAINILKLYNDLNPENKLTVETCMRDLNFLKFATYTMVRTRDRLKTMSKLYNINKRPRHTPNDLLRFILHADFKASADMYLQSDTFHDMYTELPYAETVPYWQGSGVDFSFSSTSEINVKTASGDTVEISGIIGIMADYDSDMLANESQRVTTNYNPVAEFYNYYYKILVNMANFFDENFVVFFIA